MRSNLNKPVNSTARSVFRAALAAGVMALSFGASALAAEPEDVWPDLKQQMFGERIVTEDAAVALDAPYRADDAALVPITIKLPAAIAASAKKISLVIDKNPSPVAAEFTFGPAAGAGERMISTRVRVDMYSNVRAIVETADGRLLMATKFVKAAGGCSAPALKDTDSALAEAGKMQIRTLEETKTAGIAEGEIKIRHPQYSGLQLNQATGYYIPAKFLRKIEIMRGNELVLRVDGGISLSENPNIRFTFAEPAKAGADALLAVNAEDTDGKSFQGKEQPKGS